MMEMVSEFAGRVRKSLEEAKATLAKAKDDMARYYDQCHNPTPEYKVGDKVYLDASDIKTTRPSKKLAHRNLGPYPIVRRVGSHAYRLRLPQSLSRLHPVFPVVKLTLAPHDAFNHRNRALLLLKWSMTRSITRSKKSSTVDSTATNCNT